MIIPVILAGGSGTRLWPLSRQLHPKQFFSLWDHLSLLQNTAQRLEGIPAAGDPVVVCNEAHRFMIAEQFRDIGMTPNDILLEPVGRNTAPAIAAVAVRMAAKDPDCLLLVLPSDHFIRDVPEFQKTVSHAVPYAEDGYLITFGIIPDKPETGYGYIKKGSLIFESQANGAVAVERFVEKPDDKTAETYLASGNYCWNSGMFLFKASRLIQEMERQSPEILSACRKAVELGWEDLDFFRLDSDSFSACPADSIDYAVMEKTDKAAMLMLDAGWDDVGSWDALWEVGEKDGQGNILQGDVLVQEVRNSYLNATSRLLAAVGLENHVVVETADAVMISPRDRTQEVKVLVESLKREGRQEALIHRKRYRPWGVLEKLVEAERFHVNRLTIRPGASLTRQTHYHRSEHWVVVGGTARVKKNREEIVVRTDESAFIPAGVSHRLENPGKIPLEVIEVQTGLLLDEDDTVRMD